MLLNSIPVLSFLVWFPILSGCLILLFLSRKNVEKLTQNVVVGISVGCLFISVFLLFKFNKNTSELQFTEFYEWLPSLGINYSLGLDGFSLPFVALTCFMTFLVILYSLNSNTERMVLYFSLFLIMQGLMCGVFLAIDAILFYVFFEAMLIPMFLIIGIWGSSNRVYATLKFFLYTFIGSIFLLLGIIYLHYSALLSGVVLKDSFDILQFQNLYLTFNQQKWLFWGLLFAFAVKIPMWPVHTWLPDAHVEAPTGGSVILAAITLKIGGYAMIRFILPITTEACYAFSWVVVVLSLIAIVYIGFVAIVQGNMKKMVAYSSISHMGFVTLGLFLIFKFSSNATIFDGVTCIEGAMFQMISHGFIAGALFFCVGMLYERAHTKYISDFGGVVNKMPVFSIFFMLFAMSNTGLPGTSGFVGEFLIILSTFKVSFWVAFLTGTTLILSATYTLWMYKRVVFGIIKNDIVEVLLDLELKEKIILSCLGFCVLFFGVYPHPLLAVMDFSVENLVYHILKFNIGIMRIC